MKAKPAKTTKPANKAAINASGKPKAAAKAAKSVGKASVKPAKTTKAAKPVARPVVKTAAKKVVKPIAKAKPAIKKAAAKAVSKPVAKKVLAKDIAKPAAKKLPPKAKAIIKPVIKASPKATPKAAPKVTPKPKPVSKVSVTSVKTKPLPADAKKPEKALGKPVVAAPVLVAPPRPAVSSNGLPPPPPLKPGRRSSSRALAHMPPPAPMVPTHAPDAAKASYSTMTERVIAPPPHVAAKKDPKLANNWKTKTAQTLTDEEVKAMPDAEYMNDMQMAFFRHKLSILKQDIHNSAGATTEHLREDTVVVPDPADRATIEEEHALELRTRDRERKLLKKIEQSITRIDSGDYGYCDETGEPIGVGRLIARPTASLSLEAQQRRELKQKMFGD